MVDLRRDPIVNIVYYGIKRDIQVALENECYRAAVILIYAGIDAMAFLSMPKGQLDVTSADFIRWAEEYIRFPCEQQLTGLDLYGARCAALHAYGSESSKSRKGECRQVGYMDASTPEVRYDPKVSTGVVIVSIKALAEAFFNGVDRYLIHVFSDPARSFLANQRFEKLLALIPLTREQNGSDSD